MKHFKNQINSRTLILVIFLGLVITSCEWIFSLGEDEEPDYHHKISVTRLFCDSVGNTTFHLYYDSEDKLLKSINTLPDGHNIYELEPVYKGNTIGIGEYTYTLDAQNRVVHIVHHSDEYTYEFNGELLSKATSQTAAAGHYTTYYFYENGKLVSDSVVSDNFASVTHYTFSDILRPDFMVDQGPGFGLIELKQASAYLEESTINKTYSDGKLTLSVTTVNYSYSVQDNRVVCNISGLETPKVSDNCMDYQITWTLETDHWR